MKQENKTQNWEEAWSRAVEQASETEPTELELDENEIASAAGLQIKAKIHVGYYFWSALTASNCCTVDMGC